MTHRQDAGDQYQPGQAGMYELELVTSRGVV